ncbi:hypothetical protein J19TS2_21250 [Cohnella xylanilytica]|uniref:YheC/YheD family endospore coat-associated protein n=1 Tax=Cohnella xylanilytica TaxID=557555 RepID=UPI001B23FF88|nr:YheC/YheD family protein [Cohnella xylanilytica]GIO12570.1 hypothetical protein J19TS2_21250 [Cohnella xylanilytica]
MPVICPASDTLKVAESVRKPRRSGGAAAPAGLALGIAVCEREGNVPFAEASFVRRLIASGPAYGLDVFAFAPSSYSDERGTVRAWIWNGGWSREERAAPALAYDRGWPRDREERAGFQSGLSRMSKTRGLKLLNGRLPGKAEVYRALSRDAGLRRWLPPTAAYRGTSSLAEWLGRRGGAAFLKPSNGSQGRGVVAVAREEPGGGLVRLSGRTGANRSFRIGGIREAEALRRIDRWIGGRPYVMQPLLELRGADGEPFDLRVLMQRGGQGSWTTAGTAVRCGRSGAVTANLHGGGTPRSAEGYLTELFGGRAAAGLLEELREAAASVVERLEESFGRFAELGLDFGIDRSGKLWFLEANAKPGRASMACAGGAAAAEAAERPLAYARYILLRSPGRVFHEFDSM